VVSVARSRLLPWLPALAYMALIFWFSSQSNPVPELTERVWDKLLHSGGYAVLGVFYAVALARQRMRFGPALVLAIALTSGYAASDEFHQSFVPGRNSDVRDWIADTIGGSAGAAACAAFLSKLKTQN
jgi:VanZ family protein